MRAAVLVILAFVLGACVTRDASVQLTAPPQTSGAWKIEQRVDRISGEPAPAAFIVTSRTTYTRTNNFYAAGLELACFNKHPVIRLVFGFRIGSNRNSIVAYRFDEKPGRDAVATILADHKTIVIDNQAEVSRLMEELASSNVLLVRVNSLFAGRSTAEFRVQGAPPAIAAIIAGCPWPDAPKRTASRASITSLGPS
jgi:hypothetical protein